MTDISSGSSFARPKRSILSASAEMKRRNAAETRFRAYGVIAIAIALVTLAVMLFTILRDGVSSFHQATLSFPMELSAETLVGHGRVAEPVAEHNSTLFQFRPDHILHQLSA